MKFYPDNLINSPMPWRVLCCFALLLFLAAVPTAALLVRQKQLRLLWANLPVLVLSYFLAQCFLMAGLGFAHSEAGAAVVSAVAALPVWVMPVALLFLTLPEVLLALSIRHREKNRITPMSVKEAVDSLPAGILCWAPGNKKLLVNRAMEELCRKTAGGELIDGASFRETLFNGELIPGCRRIPMGGECVVALPDGEAYKLSESDITHEKYAVRMLLALNITEAYRKNLELTAMREKVEALGRRLEKFNREIVSVTTEREILNAKIRIHDEFGSNLLAIKRYLLNGGGEAEKAALLEHTRRNISFLKNDASAAPAQDEYELLFSMAARLGVTIRVAGELPEAEPHKPVIAAAIHECFTNTLRHARGDALRIEVKEDGGRIRAVFTGNGAPPESGIVEKGGLRSLRELTEQAGGSMTIRTNPAFTVVIELPKEDAYGL